MLPGFDELCKKLEKSFTINGKATSTLKNYKRSLSHLAIHCKINPIELEKEAIDDYLFHCKNLHTSAEHSRSNTPSESFFKHTIYGLRAAYKVVGMTEIRVMLPQIKRQNDLPIILNRKEVKQLIESPRYLKHRLIIALLYGCGLRNYELCNLEQKDLDFERKTVFVKKQKGNQDRYVPLCDMLIRGLKKYLATENPYKWVFNSQVTDQGQALQFTQRGVQWCIKEAKAKLGLKKKITAHIFRHTYATHLLEDGLDIVSVKELLGHARIETTLIYLHVANLEKKQRFSPLETLYPPQVEA